MTSDSVTKSSLYNVTQLASIYQFPTPNKALNKVVAVVSFGGGIYGTIDANGFLTNGDVQKNWEYEGINVANMPQVIVHLVSDATNDLTDCVSTRENTLDVSVIGSCCPSPNLTIILFIFPTTYTFSKVFQTILTDLTIANKKYNPTIISVSWGCPEILYLNDGNDFTGELKSISTILETATQNGVNICVATGDTGSTDNNGTDRLSIDFPSGCPYVTAVGGTSLKCPSGIYDANTIETVWNDGVNNGSFCATGGGISEFYEKPAYQSVANGNFRCVPDIALNSASESGIELYINGILQQSIGGTSLAAPMFAGFLASLNQITIPFVNNILYNSANITTCFHDIVSGCNYNTSSNTAIKSYTAKSGYDCCCGLGSIIGNNLSRAIIEASIEPKSNTN